MGKPTIDDLNHSYVKLPEGMGVPGGNFDGAKGGRVGKSPVRSQVDREFAACKCEISAASEGDRPKTCESSLH